MIAPLLAAVLLASPAEASDPSPGLVALPTAVSLTGPADFQTLLVQARRADGTLGAVVPGVVWSSSDESVVVVKDGRAAPAGDGTATLTATATATADGRAATVAVTVTDFAVPHAWSFRNHVQSVLTKRGCNMGACHGAAAGKGGFLLSLRGYDPDTDFFAITRAARGRRIVPGDPARSLLLTKPTGAVAAQGRAAVRGGRRRLQGAERMGRRRHAPADAGRSAAGSARNPAGAGDAGRRRRAADRGDRALHRRSDRGRDPLGEVHRRRRDRRHGVGRRGDDRRRPRRGPGGGVVSRPQRRRHRRRAPRRGPRGADVRGRSPGRTSSTSSSCKN